MILQEKARFFNLQLGGPADFKASSGWLHKFTLRFGLHSVKIQGEKLAADAAASNQFCIEFPRFLADNNYVEEDTYNGDESGVYWRSIIRQTYVAHGEGTASGFKDCKELSCHVTVMFCANATGTQKNPLYIIGRSVKPKCFLTTDMTTLPFVYGSQKSAWMDQFVFKKWYKFFLEEVVKKHEKEGRRRKVLLLMDNCRAHPPRRNCIN